MFFSIYLIKVISLYIILLLYWGLKNFSLFKFHREIIKTEIIDKIIIKFIEEFVSTFNIIIAVIYVIAI